MKHVYPKPRKTLLSTLLLTALATGSFAQNPTTVTNSNDCNVVEDFNLDRGGFTSYSLYAGRDQVEFYYHPTPLGYWLQDNNLALREASIISSVYNSTMSGSTIVGFKYQAPPESDYRIRVINAQCNCTGGEELLATTAIGYIWTPLPATEGRICVKINDEDIHQGQHVRYEISIRTKLTGEIIIDDFSLGEVAQSPLPVTFKGIVARSENSVVNVQWEVADEIDVRGYEVERSTNGMRFETVGFVNAHGKPVYSYTDVQPVQGTVYYRVKNVDIDGKYEYSSITRVTNKRASALKLFPMPAQQTVTLQHERITAQTTITLTTAEGRVVRQIRPVADTYQTQISLQDLKPGMYLLRLDNGQGTPEAIKLLKQ